jgi:plasmid maintenance system antidote protein VapI
LALRKSVSPNIAVRLGKLFGNGAELWIAMQAAHDTWQAERAMAREIKKIPTLTDA